MMKQYQNPIIPCSPRGNTSDPYVLRHNGYYYHCYSNNQGVYISKADNLWDVGNGETKLIYDCTQNGALKEWFAPELHHIDGKWYIYAAPDYGNWMHTMTVLIGEGDSPMCEYKNAGAVKGLEGQWTIDGTVMFYQGELYFIWTKCSEMFMSKMADPLTLIGKTVTIAKPELPFETRVGLVNEGPAVLYRNDKIHIVSSGNDSKHDDYCLGLLTYNCQGDILDVKNWIKADHAVFEKTDSIFGPGHCSFTTVTEGERDVDYIVYHANLMSGSGWNGRNVFVQSFEWDENGFPIFGMPRFDVDI